MIQLLLAYLVSILPVVAQEAGAEEEKQVRAEAHVTVIALGAIAKRRYKIPEKVKITKSGEEKIVKGVAILIPPKAGESPPATLYYKEKEDDKGFSKLRVGFNNPGSIYKMKANREYRLYRRNEKAGDGYEDYVTIPKMVENSQTLCFLTQQSKRTNRWLNQPKLDLIHVNSEQLKAARLYMRNLSLERVYLRIGDAEQVVLKPDDAYIFQGEDTENMIKVLAGKGRAGKVLLIRTGIRIPAGNLTTFAFYNADPATNSGKSVGVCRVVTTRLKFAEAEKK